MQNQSANKIIYLPVFNDRPSNPARVYMNTGVIEVNKQAFDMLTPFQQKFTLEHEKGHFALKTYDELEADKFALRKLALTEPYSLKKSIKTVSLISKNNPEREASIILEALRIAADNGSKKAKEMLNQVANAEGESVAVSYTPFITFSIILIVLAIAFYLIKK